MDKDIFDDLVEGLEEAIAVTKGEAEPKAIYFVFTPDDIKALRRSMKLSQRRFAAAFHISVNTLCHWEQGNRVPDRPAQNYLRVIQANPKAVLESLAVA